MMNYDPHVRKLADGKTEITTRMISEAEKTHRNMTTVNYPEHYYSALMLGAANMSYEERERHWQTTMMQAPQANPYLNCGFNHMEALFNFSNIFGSKCPYCGR
jgi:hypothetical protein